jgi:hypothetical protein
MPSLRAVNSADTSAQFPHAAEPARRPASQRTPDVRPASGGPPGWWPQLPRCATTTPSCMLAGAPGPTRDRSTTRTTSMCTHWVRRFRNANCRDRAVLAPRMADGTYGEQLLVRTRTLAMAKRCRRLLLRRARHRRRSRRRTIRGAAIPATSVASGTTTSTSGSRMGLNTAFPSLISM